MNLRAEDSTGRVLRAGFGAVLLGCVFLLSAAPAPQQANAFFPRHPLQLITDFELNQPVTLQNDFGGLVPSTVSGQIRLLTQEGGSSHQPQVVADGLLYLESVPFSMGETGPITLWIEGGTGQAQFFGDLNLSISVHARALLTYDAIDHFFGVQQYDDYTESYNEEFQLNLNFNGVYDRRNQRFSGPVQLDFWLLAPLVGAIDAGFMSFDDQFLAAPEFLVASCPKEICIEICYADQAAKDAWKNDVETMIDDANTCWKACGIRVRTKVRASDKCVKVILYENFKEGGGGLCQGKGKNGNCKVGVGHNVVKDCGDKGVTTTFGQVLAHELGHSLGLPQKNDTPNLMADCAPNCTILPECCEIACKGAQSTPSAEDSAAGAGAVGLPKPTIEEETFTLTNNTGKDANDLHLKFSRNAWVTDAGGFKSDAGSSSSGADFGRGEVKKGASTTIKVKSLDRKAKLKAAESYWTKDGANIGGV